jgi:hypothetical protein
MLSHFRNRISTSQSSSPHHLIAGARAMPRRLAIIPTRHHRRSPVTSGFRFPRCTLPAIKLTLSYIPACQSYHYRFHSVNPMDYFFLFSTSSSSSLQTLNRYTRTHARTHARITARDAHRSTVAGHGIAFHAYNQNGQVARRHQHLKTTLNHSIPPFSHHILH